MASTSTVRCVVYGVHGDVEFCELLGFLHGAAVAQGSKLEISSEILSSAAEMKALATEELEKDIVNVPYIVQQNATDHLSSLFARISVSQKVYIVFGKMAILQWIKQHLLESSATLASITLEHHPLRLFISGDRAHVGKSTVCLGLIGSLLQSGYAAKDIAYMKPATQCQKPQLVTKFCRQQGIACCDVGPILFYKGFTREFLKGETETSIQLLEKAETKLKEISRGTKIVIIDGVGYPAVGSICGVSNAHVAKKLKSPVVLVGTKGVGDAVDSFNLNATYFMSHNVKVLGSIFNRLPEDGFYSLEHCRENVLLYFKQFQVEKRVYGFLPELQDCDYNVPITAIVHETTQKESVSGVLLTSFEEAFVKKVVEAFHRSIDVTTLLADVQANQGLN